MPSPAEQARIFLSRLTALDRDSRWFLPVCGQGGDGRAWAPGSQRTGLKAAALMDAAGRAAASRGDSYVSVSAFCGDRRTAGGLRQVVDLFFDVDVVRAHVTGSMADADASKDAALALLEAAVAAGEFPEPSMVVDTGRGLQLHLLLGRSVSARRAGGRPNTALLQHVARLHSKLMGKLEQALSEIEWLVEVDRSCSDFTRLCRLPGTWNSKAGCMARLVSASGPVHGIDALRSYVRFGEAPARASRPAGLKAHRSGCEPSSGASCGAFLVDARTAALESLQLSRRRRGEDMGYRNEMVWAYMNNLFNCMPIEGAYAAAEAFNARFSRPLPQSELLATMRGLKRRGRPYRLSNARLAEHIGMTQEEIESTGFMAACSSRAVERRLACEATAERRERRNALILSLAAQGVLYAEIARRAECSKRTVSGVLAANRSRRRMDAAAVPAVTAAERRLAQSVSLPLGGRAGALSAAVRQPIVPSASEAVMEAGGHLRSSLGPAREGRPGFLGGCCKKLSTYSCAPGDAWGGPPSRSREGALSSEPSYRGSCPHSGSQLSTSTLVGVMLSTFGHRVSLPAGASSPSGPGRSRAPSSRAPATCGGIPSRDGPRPSVSP